jgi:hypothetical protein
MTGLTDALAFLAEKQAMAKSGFLDYIRPHTSSLDGVRVTTYTLYSKEFSKPSKSSLIKFLGVAQAL